MRPLEFPPVAPRFSNTPQATAITIPATGGEATRNSRRAWNHLQSFCSTLMRPLDHALPRSSHNHPPQNLAVNLMGVLQANRLEASGHHVSTALEDCASPHLAMATRETLQPSLPSLPGNAVPSVARFQRHSDPGSRLAAMSSPRLLQPRRDRGPTIQP